MMKSIFSIASVLLFCGTTFAEIIHVPGDQPTIQAGIDVAVNGDTVLVDTGRYVENINYNGKNIVVGSLFLTTDDTFYITQTVIDGNQNGSVATFINGEDSSAILTGFTITNGLGESSWPYSGGGITCRNNSRPTLSDVIISENSAESRGGGMYCSDDSNPTLTNVTISGNFSAYNGGGIYFDFNSSVTFDSVNRCNIFLNNAGGIGYDLYAGYNVPTINVVVDTFTVMNPMDCHAHPINNFTFDILNAIIEQVEADLYVNPNGDNNNTGLSPDEPLQTITFAITKTYADSFHPHTIYLAEGTYSPSTNGESYPLNCISYISISGTSEETTILDAEGESRVINCYYGNNFNIEKMMVQNGVTSSNGGGIYCYYSSPILQNVTISGNFAWHYGGGIYCWNSSAILSNVTISGNHAFFNDGGGIYCYGGSPTFVNVTISGNWGGGPIPRGGGIALAHSSPILTNVTISGNYASHGSNIFLFGSCPILVNTILWNDYSSGIYFSHHPDGFSIITISYSNVRGGYDGIISNDYGIVNWLEGNINADPLFVGGDPFDYHLTENSPCIDAGTAFFIWNDDTLINLPDTVYYGNAPDMGAYESEFEGIVDISSEIPKTFTLSQNYPNPFNPTTTFRFGLPRQAYVTLKVYNLLGQEVVTLVDERKLAGYHQVKWDVPQSGIGSGIYFYRIEAHSSGKAGKFVKVRKCLLVK